MVIVDAYSKWIEVYHTKNPNAEFTLNKLYECACRFGFPSTIVTDNGTPFKNADFGEFTSNFGVTHIFTAPGFPASNGQAESAVKIIKKGVRAALNERNNIDLKVAINNLLFDYRTTPHTSTLESPAKLFLNREIRNRFSLIKPPTTVETIENNQRTQIKNYNGRGTRQVVVGEKVWARDYSNPNKKSWIAAQILARLGERNFLVKLRTGRSIKRHIDQLRLSRTDVDNVDHRIPRVGEQSSDSDIADTFDTPRRGNRDVQESTNDSAISDHINPPEESPEESSARLVPSTAATNETSGSTEDDASGNTETTQPPDQTSTSDSGTSTSGETIRATTAASPHHRSTRTRKQPDRLQYDR